ncbi:hypothetical protein ACJ41O_001658 [Fusarium nematophilum]
MSALAQACLASCLARLRDPSFRPLHAFDPQPHYSYGYGPLDDWIPGWEREFVGTPVEVVDLGQPSWVEEMRALRAMWIIQLTGEVKSLIADKADMIGWPSQDVETLSRMDAADLVALDKLSRPGIPEDVKSAIWYLETLGDMTKDTYYRLPRPPASTRWITAPPPEEEYFYALMGFRLNGKFHWLHKGTVIPEDATPVRGRKYKDPKRWGQTESALDWESPAMRMFRSLTFSNDIQFGSPIPGVKFDSFRPLGLAFWDQRRMHLLGLVGGTHAPHRDDFYFFAWESILPAEEVASLKAGLRFGRAVETISHYLVDLRPRYPTIARDVG